jgi:hypothetical protein
MVINSITSKFLEKTLEIPMCHEPAEHAKWELYMVHIIKDDVYPIFDYNHGNRISKKTIRYLGLTSRDPKFRLDEHLKNKNVLRGIKGTFGIFSVLTGWILIFSEYK